MDLSCYVDISTARPLNPAAKRLGPNYWVVWKKAPDDKLPEPWRTKLRFLYRYDNSPTGKEGEVSLCSDISECSIKGEFRGEFQQCPRLTFGLCADATMNLAGGGSIELPIISIFAGISKQAVDQVARRSHLTLMRRIIMDPELKEFLSDIGVDPDAARKRLAELEAART